MHVCLSARRRAAGPVAAALRRVPAACALSWRASCCGWRGFEPKRCGWRCAELGVVPDVAMPGSRCGLLLRTADKRCFVAVRLRCRNGGVQAPINVISTPTCGVLIRILVCARGMSRKEAFARQFVTGLLLRGAGRRKDRFGGEQGRGSLRREAPTAPVCVTERVPFRWWCAVRR